MGQRAVGLPKYGSGKHKFSKPWFLTDTMFVGMLLALVTYGFQILWEKQKGGVQQVKAMSPLRTFVTVGAPACCELLATGLMNIGLLYIDASVWQMLRGAMVLFSAIFCAFFLKRPHFAYMWWSVLLVLIALVVVGVAAVLSGNGLAKSGTTQGQVIMAIFLTVGAQVIQALQVVIEDLLMHDLTASPVLIVGLEGFWGTLITSFVVMPIIQFTGNVGNEGNGIHEDTVDTFKMIGNSGFLVGFVILYAFVILAYNVFGMFTTNVTSAVVRTILEGLRTLCIWVVELILYYALKDHKYGQQHPEVGEEWNIWSVMQLAGFLLLFTGLLLYNKILRVPFMKYPDDVDEQPRQPEINRALLTMD
jgi:hypothetical protein